MNHDEIERLEAVWAERARRAQASAAQTYERLVALAELQHIEHFEFTRAKIASAKRLRIRQRISLVLAVTLAVAFLAMALMGGIDPVRASAAEIWALLRERDLQALADRCVVSVITMTVLLLLAAPMAASAWFVARLPRG